MYANTTTVDSVDYESARMWELGQRLAALNFDVDALMAELATV